MKKLGMNQIVFEIEGLVVGGHIGSCELFAGVVFDCLPRVAHAQQVLTNRSKQIERERTMLQQTHDYKPVINLVNCSEKHA